jgi:hypothetical protein
LKLASLALITVVVSLPSAEPPRIHDINFYGLRKVTAERILRSQKLNSGDRLPPSKGDLEDRISEISGVLRARLEAVCCERSDVDLFIGIEEKDGPHVSFHSEPSGDASLPAELGDDYAKFVEILQRAAKQSATTPDSEARAYEEKFNSYATDHLLELRSVLRTGSDPEQRAIAAAVIGYTSKKGSVVDDLLFAIQDPDEAVRANALRSLRALVIQAGRDPSSGIHIAPTWLIELLNSIVLADRMQACDILLTLTDNNDRSTLDQIRARSLAALVEMSRWPTLSYALRPFLLVGRIAGLKEEEIHQRWSKGEREVVIARALAKR